MNKNPLAFNNNFDLIRLFAALQVVIVHSLIHLKVQVPPFVSYLSYIPGLPIFFFISGFLVFQSYSNIQHDRLKIFFINRVLRIYPALILCVTLTALSVYLSGYLNDKDIGFIEFIKWIFSSITFFQFYNPGFLKEYGVGSINGSLWTISVELQFYMLTPILFAGLKNYKRFFLLAFMVLVIINAGNTFLNERITTIQKLFDISCLPWLYMFVVGAYLSTNLALQKRILSINLWIYIVLYISAVAISNNFSLGLGNRMNFVCYVLLCLLIFKLAFSKAEISYKLLKGNDFSYGVYIYHMPVVNLLLFLGIHKTVESFAVAVVATICISVVSWYMVEKPALRLKKVALRTYKTSSLTQG